MRQLERLHGTRRLATLHRAWARSSRTQQRHQRSCQQGEGGLRTSCSRSATQLTLELRQCKLRPRLTFGLRTLWQLLPGCKGKISDGTGLTDALLLLPGETKGGNAVVAPAPGVPWPALAWPWPPCAKFWYLTYDNFPSEKKRKREKEKKKKKERERIWENSRTLVMTYRNLG